MPRRPLLRGWLLAAVAAPLCAGGGRAPMPFPSGPDRAFLLDNPTAVTTNPETHARRLVNDDFDVMLTPTSEGVTIVAKDKTGKVLFEGPYSGETDRGKVPEKIDRFIRLENVHGRFSEGMPPGITDTEWAVLRKRTEAVLIAQDLLRLGRGTDTAATLPELRTDAMKDENDAGMARAMQALIAAEDQPDNSRRQARAAYLEAWRLARQRLEDAQSDLVKVSTVWQEALLVHMGMLDDAYDGPDLPATGAPRDNFLAKLRHLLAVAGDPEWQVIRPRIEAVLDLQRQLQAGHEADPLGLLPEKPTQDKANPLLDPANALAERANQQARSEDLEAALKKFRDARKKVSDKLIAAQRSLSQVLDFHQEGVLIRAGILDPIAWN